MNAKARARTIRVSVADLYPNFETGSTLSLVETRIVRVAPDAEARATALAVYGDSASRDVGVEGEDNHHYIEVALMPAGWTESRQLDLADVSHITLALTFDNAIVFSGARSQTLAELQRLQSFGLQGGDPGHLIAYFQGGRGGDGGELLEAINQITNHLLWFAIDSGLAWIGGRSFRRFWKSRGLTTARLIATDWARRGLTSSAYLREFVERKESWDLDQLSTLLKIKRRHTRRLLNALGFERSARGSWSSGKSRQARENRDQWLRDEQRPDWWAAIHSEFES
jgi:hypothetical protein